MNTTNMHTVTHLNRVLTLDLDYAQEETFSLFCAAVARHVQVSTPMTASIPSEPVGDYASVYGQGVRERVFSAGFVEALARGIVETPDGLGKFLDAAGRVPSLARKMRIAATVQHGEAIDADIFDAHLLTQTQRRYATDVSRSLTNTLGGTVVPFGRGEAIGSPALFVVAAVIAKKRYPARVSDISSIGR